MHVARFYLLSKQWPCEW